MAKMIPPYLAKTTKSPGEKVLFNKFRNDPDTQGWIVLHSLDVAEHSKRLSGELDFVVIIPGHGVLCLEIKAHGKIERKDGRWYFGSGGTKKASDLSPFKQASDSMHAIRQYISKRNRGLQRTLIYSAVFFTHVDFDETSPEWHSWQSIDRKTIIRKPISIICLEILHQAHCHTSNTGSAKWYNSKNSRPSGEQCNELCSLLRHDFEFYQSPSCSAELIDDEIKQFTEEQFYALDVLRENDRVVFKGPAGTGKTLLAIEAARRYVSQGKKTLFICYNRLLGQWLTNQVGALDELSDGNLTAGNIDQILLPLSGLSPSESDDPEFWNHSVPMAVINRVLEGVISLEFDAVVIDEAQDLLTETYLDVIDLFLVGGMAGGRWAMFGDYERQAIYTRKLNALDFNLDTLMDTRAGQYFKFPLRVNCRNTEKIARGIELSCGLNPGYSRYIHPAGIAGVTTRFYRNTGEQTHLLLEQLELIQPEFKREHIVILSSKRDAVSAAKVLETENLVDGLAPYRAMALKKTDEVRYCSIHGFKGMESPAVILTDINKITGEQAKALLYIGMSRARSKLIILMHECCRTPWLSAIQKGFEEAAPRGGGNV
jgi:DNA polymerase III delta prime subunit